MAEAHVPDVDPAVQAAQALNLSAVNPSEAWVLSAEAERDARINRDWSAVSVARRAAGIAALQLGRLDAAVEKLRGAVEAARRQGDRQLAGEARMSLATALVQRGSTGSGMAAIEVALTELHGPSAARARVQRAAINQAIGRVDDALEDLRLALPVLRRSGDVEWEVRGLSNRSSMLAARRQFAAAETDLLRAQRLCRLHGLHLGLAYVEHNLGWVRGERGDVPAALRHFDAAAEQYGRLGIEIGSLPVDRAATLFSVRLLDEARLNAEQAVRTLHAQQRATELPEAQLMLSTVALLQGDLSTASTVAGDAARACSRLGRREWLALARYAVLQAQLAASERGAGSTAGGSPDQVPPKRLRSAARDLAAAGWTVPALEARLLAGRLELNRGRPEVARADLARAAKARRSGPADARARAWYAEALLRQSEGRRGAARSALRAGLRVMEEYRASLGATELRAHVSTGRGSLARAGLQMALEDRDPKAVHWWGERTRASADLMRSVRPPDDPVLADELQDLRVTMTEIAEARGEGRSTTALVARQVQLEHKIRDHVRRFPSSVEQTAPPPPLNQLAAELGETVMVEFVDLNDVLHAVTLVDGRARLHELGPIEEIRHQLRHLPFALRRLVHVDTRPTQLAAARSVVEHAGAVLDDRLIGPLATTLGDRPLLVVPAGWLQAVPWSILPSCRGRPVSVAPSSALWHMAFQRRPSAEGSVVAIAGPGLPGALAEARAVAALYPAAVVLEGPTAVAPRVAQAMDGARMAHVAAHGTARSDNPLFSSLLLTDGPFTVYDLERLGTTPHQVVLAACNAGAAHVTPGQEILGLSAALLAQQTATLIAPVVPIDDADTASLMTTYHRLLLDGQRPASALAAAQQAHADDGIRAQASAAGFLCLGVG